MAETEPVLVHISEADRRALRREALARVERGEARRVNVSAVLRDVLAAWRRAAEHPESAARRRRSA